MIDQFAFGPADRFLNISRSRTHFQVKKRLGKERRSATGLDSDSGSEVGDAIYRKVSQAWKDGIKVVAWPDLESPTGFRSAR